MTENEVVTRLTFQGDKAVQGMKQVAEATQKAGQAARQTQQQFNAAQVDAERMARDRREDAVRAYMAAADPERYGKARRVPTVDDLVNQQIARDRRADAVKARLAQIDPKRYGRQDDPLDQNGLLRAARPLFLANIGSNAFQGAGRAVRSIAESGGNLGRAIDKLTDEVLGGIPIIGGFFRAGNDFAAVIAGLAGTRAGAAFVGQRAALQYGGAASLYANQIGGQMQRAGLVRETGGARIRADFAAGTADALRAGGFAIPFVDGRDRPGVADAQLGVFRAERDAAAATAEAKASQDDYAQRKAETEKRLAVIARQEQAARDDFRQSSQIEDRARQSLARPPSFGSELAKAGRRFATAGVVGLFAGGWADYKRSADLQGAQAAAAEQMKTAQAELAALQKQREAAAKALSEIEKANADKQIAAAEKRLALEKARVALASQKDLGIAQERLDRARGGVLSIGLANPGENEQLLAASDQLKRFGVKSLTARQKAMLGGNAITGYQLSEAGRVAGESSPVTNRLLANAGFANLDDLTKARDAAKQKTDADSAAADAAFAADVAGIVGRRNEALAKILAEVFDGERQNLKAQIVRELQQLDANRQLAAQQAGGG